MSDMPEIKKDDVTVSLIFISVNLIKTKAKIMKKKHRNHLEPYGWQLALNMISVITYKSFVCLNECPRGLV